MESESKRIKGKDESGALRREAGIWLKERREAAGLSQRELAARSGFEYYTFISQLESGRGRVPPDRYESYAKAVDTPAREFAVAMLRFYEPVVYKLIFGEVQEAKQSLELGAASGSSLSDLAERLARLEAKLES